MLLSHEGARDPSALLLGPILQVHLNADYTRFDSPRRCSLILGTSLWMPHPTLPPTTALGTRLHER